MEREHEHNQRMHQLEDREEAFRLKRKEIERQKNKEILEANNQIKTLHELVKTVMNLHREEFSSFEKESKHKGVNAKNFSFDMTKNVKDIEEEAQSENETNSGEKDKIIIREPLEMFELENDGSSSGIRFNEHEKNSQQNSEEKEGNGILGNYSNELILDQACFKEDNGKHKILMSPKFNYFDKEEEEKDNEINEEDHNILLSNKSNSKESPKVHKNIDYLVDFSNEKYNNDSSSEKKNTNQETDYRERLRQSLLLGANNSKREKQEKLAEKEEYSEENILSPSHSDGGSDRQKKANLEMSPLDDNYDDFEEFRNNYKKKQQEMLEEFNSMNRKQFELVQQFASKLEEDTDKDKQSETDTNEDQKQEDLDSANESNKDVVFSPNVSLIF
jgi:hypothetical protein